MAGLRLLLDAHDPYPALLFHYYWEIVDANRAMEVLCTGCAPELLEPPITALRLCLHDSGMAPRIKNLETWRAHLLHQLGQRVLLSGGDPRLVTLQRELTPRTASATGLSPVSSPVLALEIVVNEQLLRLFSVTTRIEAATDVTLEGLHLETFLPADEATRRELRHRSAPRRTEDQPPTATG